jgi:F-type H+-transporting ATPase subunit delta
MKAAKRYAKALFELASDNLDEVQKDMQLIKESFEASPELQKILKNPTIAPSQKAQIVNQIFGGKVSDYTTKLLELLGQKDRLSLLEDIATAFDNLYKKAKGIKEASVISAVPLNDTLKDKILNKIKELTGSQQIKLTNEVNPDLIGGFILNMDDLRYDASVSGKLAKIKSKLVE